MDENVKNDAKQVMLGQPNNLTRTLYFGQMTKAKVANSHLPT